MLRILQAEDIVSSPALNATMRQMLEECAEPLESDLTARHEPILGCPSNVRQFAPDMPRARVAMVAKVATP